MRFFNIFIAALLLGAIAVSAHGDAHGDSIADQLEETKRDPTQTTVELHGTEIHYKSGSSEGFTSSLELDAAGETDGDKALFKLRYLLQGSGSNDPTKFKQEFRLKFFEIIEYQEANKGATTDGFNKTDTAVQNYSTKSWNNWAENTPSGANYRQWFITSKDGYVMFNVSVTTNTSATLPSGVVIDANTAKFDLTIINFPYNATSNSFLAVAARVETDEDHESEEEVDHHDAEHNEEGRLLLTQSGAGLQGSFAWKPTVTAIVAGQSQSADVIASGFKGDKRSKVAFFAFKANQPSRIEWDPEVTAVSNNTNGAFSVVMNSFLIAALLLLTVYWNL